MKDQCEMVPNDSFDVDRSIWYMMDQKSKDWAIRNFGEKPEWSQSAISEIEDQFRQVPRSMPESQDLLKFMRDECDFRVEHADGSFMDHLTFCRDYGLANYKTKSVVPLFLHSILGVGTNIIPMGNDKIPQLQELVTPADFRQIQAFPSIFRRVMTLELVNGLSEAVEQGRPLIEVSFCRLVDNEPLTLTMDELWTQLNYQLIHLLDFLPLTNWSNHVANSQFQVFARLLDLLTRAGQLQAQVAWNANDDGFSVRDMIAGELPGQAPARAFQRVMFEERSATMGHDMSFELGLASNI